LLITYYGISGLAGEIAVARELAGGRWDSRAKVGAWWLTSWTSSLVDRTVFVWELRMGVVKNGR
jgi:hypothetical protein